MVTGRFSGASSSRRNHDAAEEFLAVNQANAESWRPIVSTLDPRFARLGDDNAFFIVGKTASGEVVACQACRLFDWRSTNFKDECESLRLYYDDPDAHRNPAETSRVTAFAARGTSGLVGYTGAAWYRPDFRGKGLLQCLPRISRAYAVGKWNIDTAITLISESNMAKGVYQPAFHGNMEWAVEMTNNRVGSGRFAYVWCKAEEIDADLKAYLTRLAPAADRRALG